MSFTSFTIHGSYGGIMRSVKDLLGHENWSICVFPNKKVLTVNLHTSTVTTNDLAMIQPLTMYFDEIQIRTQKSILQRFREKYPHEIGKEEGDCPICMESFLDTDVIKLGCLHLFHNECIENWVESKTQSSILCPYCRQEIEL